ncbi:MAG: DMT family transporter [Rhodoferax sp.]|nr:DMT family transporter [Rhodoferax sp.]
MNRNVLFALLAAALFGASTPFAKLLVGNTPPVLLAGLLYLGSGLGLTLIRLVRDRGWQPSGLSRAEWPWLLGAIFFGGVAGPVALMFGLLTTSGSSASLLLNLEAVLTAAIAWVVFKENADKRIVLGMASIVAGGLVLSWPGHSARSSDWVGPVLIGVACLCWAIDNNLTRKVSASDALFVAGSKGVVAGLSNSLLALVLGATLPGVATTLATMGVGLLGYGFSLVLFVLALRGLGTARTGAYFSTAPFIGAFIALAVFGESTGLQFWMAALLMGIGVGLHLTEKHEHEHEHGPLEYEHTHTHGKVRHSHAHFPDIHHRHGH